MRRTITLCGPNRRLRYPRPVEHAAETRHLRHVDIDSVDPSVAPGIGTPEPGGLSASQTLIVVETLGEYPAVGAADLMEVASPYDPTDETARLAAYPLTTLLEWRFAE